MTDGIDLYDYRVQKERAILSLLPPDAGAGEGK